MFHPFSLLHFLPEFVPHTEFKGRPEDTKWNVLYHTALRNYAAISLQVPSILSILLGKSTLSLLWTDLLSVFTINWEWGEGGGGQREGCVQ